VSGVPNSRTLDELPPLIADKAGQVTTLAPSTDLANQQAVVGALLIGAPWTQVADVIDAQHYLPKFRPILAEIAALAAGERPHDCLTVAGMLESRGHLQVVGGLATLSQLARETPTAAHCRTYALAVRESAIKARLPAEHRDPGAIAELRRTLAELDALEAPGVPEYYPFERLDCIAVAVRVAVLQGLGLDRGTVNALLGQPNSGKTAVAVSAGVHIAAGGREWLGLKITGGPVLYIAAEAPGSVKMRARAAAARLPPYKHLPFYISSAVPGLGDPRASEPGVNHIIATIRRVEELEEQPVALVLIDTLASCLGGGNENGDGMVLLTNAAKKIAAATDACVVLVHHPSKADAGSARGHTSLAAACDSIILIEKESEVGDVRTATLVKARDHATGAQLRFALSPVSLPDRDSFGDLLSTVVVEPATGRPTLKRPGGKNQEALLTDLERQHRTGKTHFTEAEIITAAKTLGMRSNRNAPRNALMGLLKGGYVTGSAASYTLKFPPGETS